ncbi:hypothetical protein B0H34DRAFT_781810 [Crassisporium funariophilum]|nr:hypothetical protein B0H34DRAFT_781810 [Crassisporium funariophilum]
MATLALPPYSGGRASGSATPIRPPSYSIQPLANEETVAFTPRVGATTPHGNFVRHWPQATLILKDQDEDARLPMYGRGGRVIGELGVANTDKVVRVTIKLLGRMSLSVGDTGSACATLLSETQVLWKHDEDDSSADQRCPSILPIYFQFPYTYEAEEGKHWRLPPSFEATFLGIPALFARCIYTLSITITRTRSYKVAQWTTNKTYITMLNFRPRTRPHRPIVMLDSVFASLKPVPEEWTQLVTSMSVRPNSGEKPIDCHLFIPSVQTYALTDTIPFHLQLSSSLKSLRELLPPTSALLQLPNVNHPKTTDRRLSVVGAYAIRLSIARQVVVEVNGRRRFRTFTLGVGKMWPVPPLAVNGDACGQEKIAADEMDKNICLDWQGEVKCWAEVTAGGFSVSNLLVKDFLVLTLTPPNTRSSFLIPLQLSHPIRLVTDSWVDGDSLHPQDT